MKLTFALKRSVSPDYFLIGNMLYASRLLSLLRTTKNSVGQIANACGYAKPKPGPSEDVRERLYLDTARTSVKNVYDTWIQSPFVFHLCIAREPFAVSAI